MRERPMRKDFGEVTLERLERGVASAALIVERYGPAYYSIFERLERELRQVKGSGDAYERALAYHKKNGGAS
jgi:hypothetical protein